MDARRRLEARADDSGRDRARAAGLHPGTSKARRIPAWGPAPSQEAQAMTSRNGSRTVAPKANTELLGRNLRVAALVNARRDEAKMVVAPPPDDVLFAGPELVRRRNDWCSSVNAHEHDCMHSLGICRSLAPEEVDDLRVKFAVRQDLGVAFEAVALPDDRIHHIDLDRRVGRQVCNGVRRVQMQEHEVASSHTIVVPFGDRFGVPSGQTVATKPSLCSRTIRRMSSSSRISIASTGWGTASRARAASTSNGDAEVRAASKAPSPVASSVGFSGAYCARSSHVAGVTSSLARVARRVRAGDWRAPGSRSAGRPLGSAITRRAVEGRPPVSSSQSRISLA